jgi:hypothetical protein
MRWALLSVMLGLACQSGERLEAGAAPVFGVSADRAQLGYDAPFSIIVQFPAAARAPFDVRWRQVEGAPVREIDVSERGLRFSARTPLLSECRQGTLPWGVVPLSPRTRGEIVLEAEWRMEAAKAPQRERITLAAAARSRGLPNVPVDQRLYLGGTGWRVKDAPPGAHGAVEVRDGIGTLRPDARGIWQLVDGEGRLLRLQAGRYVETPLDCGRAGCHLEIARAAQSSPMTWALTRRLQDRAHHADATSAATRTSDDVSCALACHTTGEQGIHDGGFFDVAADLRASLSLAGVRDATELPRALRRLGSVGCLACHGPSALPEAEARWSILRSDVCAHCHDAPPRYGHVVAWQTTSMARADQDSRARSDRACTPCHTTWGFLREFDLGSKNDEEHGRVPPAGAGNIGITCPACHAVHDVAAALGTQGHLLRAPRLAPMFDDLPAEARARSATCLVCHAPRDASRLAPASASAVWAGRAGVDPETGALLAGPSPHLSIEGGCLGCHREGPDGVELGKSHGFRADRRQCASCHADPALAVVWTDERARMEKEARDLWNELFALRTLVRAESEPREISSSPPHATTTTQRNMDTPLGRAAYDLSLLLEDRGFLAHNLPYARLLLEKAKKPIERASRAARSGAPQEPAR